MPHSTSMKGSFQAAVSGQAMTEIGRIAAVNDGLATQRLFDI